jgi:hypothetical protein
VVFRTPERQCGDDRCASRATGLAAFVEDRQTMEPMIWIGGHAAGEPRSALYLSAASETDSETDSEAGAGISPRSAWLVAVAAEGVEVRRFALPSMRVRALGETLEIRRVRADATWPLPPDARGPFAWIEGDPPSLIALLGEGRAGVIALGAGAAAIEPFDVPSGTARVAACGRWIAFGTERGVTVRAPDGLARTLDVALRPPLEGALRLRCDEGGAEVLALGDGRISRARCDEEGCEEPEVIVARGVHRFDVAELSGATLVAWTDGAEGPVRLVRVTAEGPPSVSVPAPCWSEPSDGLCGEPRLASDGRIAYLATRSDRDLRVLRSEDGIVWRALPGLEQP